MRFPPIVQFLNTVILKDCRLAGRGYQRPLDKSAQTLAMS
jgi:hypothetical protein